MNVFSKELLMASSSGSKTVKEIKFRPTYGGGYTSWVLLDNGDLYSCGYNYYQGQTNDDSNPVLNFTKRASNVDTVEPASSGTYYLTKSKELWGCGRIDYYGHTSNTFVRIDTNVDLLSAGYDGMLYSKSGDVYSYGSDSGVLGTDAQKLITAKVTTSGNGVQQEAYINTYGNLYMRGNGTYGQQANGSTSNSSTFIVRATEAKDFIFPRFVAWYIRTNGYLYGCGIQYGGGSSSGNTTTFTAKDTDVVSVSASQDAYLYIKTNGELWGMGSDTAYVGSNNRQNKKRADNVASVQIGDGSSYVTTNSDLYVIGYNNYGRFGNGTTSSSTTYTKVAEDVDKAFEAEGSLWYIDTNGELWGTGYNNAGQQGNGTTTNVLTFENKMQYLT